MLDWLGIPALWESIVDWFTSPLWYWAFWWVVIVGVAWIIGKFFEGMRPFAGAVIMMASFGLFVYWYARREAKAEQKQKEEAARRRQPQPRRLPSDPFSWFWGQ